MLAPVAHELIAAYWPQIQEHMDEACNHHPFLTAKDILERLIERQADLYILRDGLGRRVIGALVIEVVKYPSCRVANILAAGGRRGTLKVLIEEMPTWVAWAKRNHCQYIGLEGRPGWERIAERFLGRSKRRCVVWQRTDVVADVVSRPHLKCRAVGGGY